MKTKSYPNSQMPSSEGRTAHAPLLTASEHPPSAGDLTVIPVIHGNALKDRPFAHILQPNEAAMKVCDAMTPEVQLCNPEDTLKDAAEAMMALNVGLLPVTDNERLVGMITDRDIAIRGVAMGLGPDSPVRDVMTEGVKYCFEDQDLNEVIENMGDLQVRRLPVLNRDKRLVGIIALGDIARSRAGDGTAAALHQISRPGGQHSGSSRLA